MVGFGVTHVTDIPDAWQVPRACNGYSPIAQSYWDAAVFVRNDIKATEYLNIAISTILRKHFNLHSKMDVDIGNTFEADLTEGPITRRKMISTENTPADGTCLKVITVCTYYNFMHVVWMLLFHRNEGGYAISYRERTLEQVLVTDQEYRLQRAMIKLVNYFTQNPNAWNQYVAGAYHTIYLMTTINRYLAVLMNVFER